MLTKTDILRLYDLWNIISQGTTKTQDFPKKNHCEILHELLFHTPYHIFQIILHDGLSREDFKEIDPLTADERYDILLEEYPVNYVELQIVLRSRNMKNIIDVMKEDDNINKIYDSYSRETMRLYLKALDQIEDGTKTNDYIATTVSAILKHDIMITNINIIQKLIKHGQFALFIITSRFQDEYIELFKKDNVICWDFATTMTKIDQHDIIEKYNLLDYINTDSFTLPAFHTSGSAIYSIMILCKKVNINFIKIIATSNVGVDYFQHCMNIIFRQHTPAVVLKYISDNDLILHKLTSSYFGQYFEPDIVLQLNDNIVNWYLCNHLNDHDERILERAWSDIIKNKIKSKFYCMISERIIRNIPQSILKDIHLSDDELITKLIRMRLLNNNIKYINIAALSSSNRKLLYTNKLISVRYLDHEDVPDGIILLEKEFAADEQCPICFVNINEIECDIMGFSCEPLKHFACQDCYDKYQNNTCPICRAKIDHVGKIILMTPR